LVLQRFYKLKVSKGKSKHLKVSQGKIFFWDGLILYPVVITCPKPALASLSRSPKLKWPGCVKMLEQKHFGKIAAIPAAVWLNFSKAFMLKIDADRPF
jgi:hypothetical protein